MVRVEVVYVAQDKSMIQLSLELPEGSTVEYALAASNIGQTHPETSACSVGIYGKVVPLTTPLRDGDRIELYRPLVIDPKEKRRRLAQLKTS